MDAAFLASYPMLSEQPQLLHQLQSLKLVVFDVDGVLTDGGLLYTEQGETIKRFNVKDGVAMKLLPKWGVSVAVITAKDSPALHQRMKELNVEHFYPGCHNKAAAFADLTTKLPMPASQIAYVGDDVIDLQVMPSVGLAMCPADAHTLLLRHCPLILSKSAGQGVAREVADLILASRMPLEEAYELAKQPEFERHV
ncbi:KdsC family phosphatase [Marinomonas posidonica]|uniref:3-deoxy-D-manno-octulosonate 8-phosphate phosphatase KdsC n=1 Tax=Marinomonas posidonica (strain CECT 7376 / NCIMB 14433 / IVIA-Po-181) TaxID=491952 RepID=F6CYS1_MARPP|nr:HAD-IIIA family hydrolase [Marinomonas posidonica]AEF55753.1 3-deoxy-D-manno-octulosonate 8-phosphate phosphatase, YrbI family [Marinomonas posidonica IVIA-Po-181]